MRGIRVRAAQSPMPWPLVDVRARLRLVEADLEAEPSDRVTQGNVSAAVAVVDLAGDAVALAHAIIARQPLPCSASVGSSGRSPSVPVSHRGADSSSICSAVRRASNGPAAAPGRRGRQQLLESGGPPHARRQAIARGLVRGARGLGRPAVAGRVPAASRLGPPVDVAAGEILDDSFQASRSLRPAAGCRPGHPPGLRGDVLGDGCRPGAHRLTCRALTDWSCLAFMFRIPCGSG